MHLCIYDCLEASSGNPVVQTKARVRAAGLMSVLSKLSFCMYIILQFYTCLLNVSVIVEVALAQRCS